MNYNKSVKKVYEQLENCIIIGLTGRTGSGCTTAAKILEEPDFSKLALPEPKPYDFANYEERKYPIIYNYMKNNWFAFTTIEASSVILSFVLGMDYECFEKFIKGLSDNSATNFRIGGEIEFEKRLSGIRHLFTSGEFSNIDKDIDKILSDSHLVETYYDYFTCKIKEYKKSFYKICDGFSCYESTKSNFYRSREKKSHLYTYLLQLFGNNLRSSGSPVSSEFNEDSFYTVAKRINNIIKIIKKHNSLQGQVVQTRVCIDAIRNPYEAFYFRDLYKSFYLVSVSTDDSERRRRLSNLDKEELSSLDEMEYPFIYDQGKIFYQQSIEECLQISDIHLYNPESPNKRYELLTNNLVKYIALMLHPGLVTPTDIERCMQIAFNAKLNSGCLSRQVGAVITDEKYYIKAVGWNDVPQGQIPCNLRCVRSYFTQNDSKSFSEFEFQDKDFTDALKRINNSIDEIDDNVKASRSFPFCFKDVYNGLKCTKNQVYTKSLHAEENAFLQISKFGGQGINGGKLFVTASPCELCSKKSYQLGIKDIYYIDPYPGIATSHILKFGKSEANPTLHLFYGAVGDAYVSLYAQRFAVKDELQLITGIDIKEKAKRKLEIQKLGFNDIKYQNTELELLFKSRNEIEFYQNICLISQIDGLDEIQKSLSWSGSSYDRTVKNKESDKYELYDNFTVDGVSYYTIKPTPVLNKNDILEYSLKTIVKDEMEVMNPILSSHIMAHTDKLTIRVKFKKDEFSKSDGTVAVSKVMLNQYADIDDNIVYKSEDVDCALDETGEFYVFEKTVSEPIYKYVYSIEWQF